MRNRIIIVVFVLCLFLFSHQKEENVKTKPTVIYTEYKFEEQYKKVNQTIYFLMDANLLDKPYSYGEKVGVVHKYQQAILIGQNDFDYQQVSIDNKVYYVDKNAFTLDYQDIIELHNSTYNTNWSGKVLNAYLGAILGPSGRETYYNLNMDGVLRIMRRMGNNDVYWIREDGVKMLGDYVMIAANLQLRPRGSLVETSLGMGIVCDTGGFAKKNKTQVDIAVNW